MTTELIGAIATGSDKRPNTPLRLLVSEHATLLQFAEVGSRRECDLNPSAREDLEFLEVYGLVACTDGVYVATPLGEHVAESSPVSRTEAVVSFHLHTN